MRSSRIAIALAVALTGVLATSCPSEPEIPGTLLATFSFVANDGGLAECTAASFQELPTGTMNFDAQFSGEPDGSVRWMTLGRVSRAVTFDGQYVTAPYSASREFSNCSADGGAQQGVVDEVFTVALLSKSQSDELNKMGDSFCPSNPMAPGVIPLDPDAGITGPGMTASGFDAVRACGWLTDHIAVAADAFCQSCSMTFDVVGTRL